MGTVFSVEVRGVPEDHAAEAVTRGWGLVRRLDRLLSPYQPDSELSRLARGDLRLAECDPDVRTALELCAEARERSGGWFDERAGGRLDPSGLVKGWAVQRAADLIVEVAGAPAEVCVNGGGDVQVVGGTWSVGITDPVAPGRLAAVVAARERCAVATSGPAERGCHILDPTTGAPPASGPASLTVVGTSLTWVDAWATAAYAMGDRAAAWLESLPGVEALAVTGSGTVWATSGFGHHAGAGDADPGQGGR